MKPAKQTTGPAVSAWANLGARLSEQGFAAKWPKGASWVAIAALVSSVLFVGVWGGFARLASAVVAVGFVKVEGDRVLVQHPEGGQVAKLLVREGQVIKAGEVLMELEESRELAGFEIAQHQLGRATLRRARFESVVRGAESMRVPTRPTDVAEPMWLEWLQEEQQLFSQRRDNLNAQLTELRRQGQAVSFEVSANSRAVAASKSAEELAVKEWVANQELSAGGFVAQARVLQLERSVQDAKARTAQLAAEQEQAKFRQLELKSRETAAVLAVRNEALQGLEAARVAAGEASSRLAPSTAAKRRRSVLAPVSGTVFNLTATNVGMVFSAKDPLLEIVPNGARLVVEAQVRPDDIAQVRTDARAELDFAALRHLRGAAQFGVVRSVSADRLIDRASGLPYFGVQITFEPGQVLSASGVSVAPGMGVDVYIQTKARTPVEYMLEPLTRFGRRAMN